MNYNNYEKTDVYIINDHSKINDCNIDTNIDTRLTEPIYTPVPLLDKISQRRTKLNPTNPNTSLCFMCPPEELLKKRCVMKDATGRQNLFFPYYDEQNTKDKYFNQNSIVQVNKR